MTLLAMLAFRSARSVSSSSFGLSSTSMIVFSIIPPRRRAPSVEFPGRRPDRACRQELRHRPGVNGGGKEVARSEERRVGKECRAGWWRYQDKEKDSVQGSRDSGL